MLSIEFVLKIIIYLYINATIYYGAYLDDKRKCIK